jgi:hypothetical protein
MGTKNNPGKFDCYQNAAPDEPMFILLGRDKHAPTLVWLWAVLRELDGEVPEVVDEARDCVTAMLQWAHAHDRKVVGLGQAALAGVLELIRAANHAVGSVSLTQATDNEVMRLFLSATKIEPDDFKAEGAPV